MSRNKSQLTIKVALAAATIVVTGLGFAGVASARPPNPTVYVNSANANAETVDLLKGRINGSLQGACQQKGLNLVTGNPRFPIEYRYTTYSGGYMGSGTGWCV